MAFTRAHGLDKQGLPTPANLSHGSVHPAQWRVEEGLGCEGRYPQRNKES